MVSPSPSVQRDACRKGVHAVDEWVCHPHPHCPGVVVAPHCCVYPAPSCGAGDVMMLVVPPTAVVLVRCLFEEELSE